jgi:hypothetical protein
MVGGDRAGPGVAELWDEVTLRALHATGVAPGWRGLEIGAESGSVADWLLEAVGTTGHVVTADVECWARRLGRTSSPLLVSARRRRPAR